MQKTIKQIIKNRALYLFLLPSAIYLALFSYAPMYGIQIAFRDYIVSKTIWGSEWVGFAYFEKYFNSYYFTSLILNTVLLSLYQLFVAFPFPIILALVLNYTPFIKLKKITQTISYAPHFISMVVLAGMLFVFLSPTNGIVNVFIKSLGHRPINFLAEPGWFRSLFVWSGVWQNAGWSSIIYLAALSAVNPELHEAAIIDGATKLQRVRYIDLPSILPTIVILLILQTGGIMSTNSEKALLLQTDPNLSVSEVISTYVYKVGILNGQYSYAAAIGLFNNIINFFILLTVNKIADTTTNNALW